MRLVPARQRLGLRWPSTAFAAPRRRAKAPEVWRTPKPGGSSGGSWKDPPSKYNFSPIGAAYSFRSPEDIAPDGAFVCFEDNYKDASPTGFAAFASVALS